MTTYTRFPSGPRGARPGKITPETQIPAGAPAPAAPARGDGSRDRSHGRSHGRSRGAAPSATADDARKLHWLAVLFILAVFIPLSFGLGSIALTPARAVMILAFIPLVAMYASGRAGPVRPEDIFLFLYVFWVALAMSVNHGLARMEFIGILMIEIATPYLMARCLIRNRAQYNAFLRFMLVMIAGVTALAVVESTTGYQIANRIFDKFGSVYPPLPDSYERRLGLIRSQTVFQHPILFGTVVIIFLAPMAYLPGRDGGKRSHARAILPVIGTFFSLSTGAWLGGILQVGLMMWDRIFRVFKARWKTFIILTIIAYITVDLISNRSPFEVFISYATLNQGTGYMRVIIFMYGMENVWANPVFGLGLNNWTRPGWLHSGSVDNFWLVQAMVYGIPAFVMIACMYFMLILGLARIRITNEGLRLQRNAGVYAMCGLALSMATVHIWGTALYMIMFTLGSLSWLHTADDLDGDEPTAPARDRHTAGNGPAVRQSRQGDAAVKAPSPPGQARTSRNHR